MADLVKDLAKAIYGATVGRGKDTHWRDAQHEHRYADAARAALAHLKIPKNAEAVDVGRAVYDLGEIRTLATALAKKHEGFAEGRVAQHVMNFADAGRRALGVEV